MEPIECSVVLPASGSGERFGDPLPKQFHRVLGEPLVVHTIRAFRRAHRRRLVRIRELVVSCAPEHVDRLRSALAKLPSVDQPPVTVIHGERTRHRSIRRCVQHCQAGARQGAAAGEQRNQNSSVVNL